MPPPLPSFRRTLVRLKRELRHVDVRGQREFQTNACAVEAAHPDLDEDILRVSDERLCG